MSELRFSIDRTAMGLEGKQGILKPNKDGVYRILAGAYNVKNSVGDLYIFNEKVKSMFVNSSMTRWLAAGQLISEKDHPQLSDFITKSRSPGQANAMWMRRLAELRTSNASGMISDVEWVEMPDKVDGRTVFGIYIHIEPTADFFKASLANPKSNTAMSVRSYVGRSLEMGEWLLETKDLFTWDNVSSGGIALATKYNSAGCESESSVIDLATYRNLEELEGDPIYRKAACESGNPLVTTIIKDSGSWREVQDLSHLAMRSWK